MGGTLSKLYWSGSDPDPAADAYTFVGDAYSLSADTLGSPLTAPSDFPFAAYQIDGTKWGSPTLGTWGGVVTWSLVANGTAIAPWLQNEFALEGIPQSTVSALSTFLYGTFETQLRSAFAAWSAVANITFIEVNDGGGQVGTGTFADIRVSGISIDGFGGTLAFTGLPDTVVLDGAAGDVFFDVGDASFFDSHSFFLVATHELGHAIGLDHSFDSNALMAPFYNGSLSGLTSDDIAGVQAIYGAAPAAGTAATYTLPVGQTTLTIVNGVSNLTVNGNGSNDSITGSSFDETINGGAGDDTLSGGSGNDVLDGGSGNDSMVGGLGNDTFIVDSVSDVVSEQSGQGTDTVQSSVSYTLGANIENLTLTAAGITGTGNSGVNTLTANANNDTLVGGSGDDVYVIAAGVSGTVITESAAGGTDLVRTSVTYTLGSEIENLLLSGSSAIDGTGNALANIITGNGAANYLTGNDGNDSLTGGAGDDTLDGGAGSDTLKGGTGNDTYIVADANDFLLEFSGEGTDTVVSSVNYALFIDFENLTLTGSAITGTGNGLDNVLTGNALNNSLDGAGGNDTLDGGAGNDTMIGGTGNDTYIVDSSADVITENANEGTDTARISANYTLGNNVENLIVVAAGVAGTGNSGANILTANANNDTLVGGAGNDTYVIAAGVTGTVITETSVGADVVQSAASYTLDANLLTLTLTGSSAINGTGNGLDNVLTGNSAANVLDGGAGNDTMIGGAGDDSYYVDSDTDVIQELAGQGNDTVYTSHFYFMPGNVETLVMTGTGDIWAVGNGAAHTMYGNSGNNSLSAGTGVATLYGGLGDDIYYLNKVSDTAIENPGEGFDTIFTTFSMTAPANFEAVALMAGTQPLSLTGGAANTLVFLYGNFGTNTLTAGGGQSILIGQFGDDVAYISHDDDQVVEAPNQGYDIIYSSISYSLSDYVEEMHLTGTADLYAIGNAGTSALYGNVGNNSLIAGSGVATMYGGLGDDMYTVNNASDVIVENANEGFDTVYSSVSYTLSANVDALQLTGTGNLSGTGNAITNFLYGNSGSNTLNGGGGVDVLTGNGGADTFVFTVGGGNDIVTDFSKAQGDKVDLTDFHTTFGALSPSIAQVGADAVITIAGQTVTLQGVTAATLAASDFLF